MTEEKFCDSWPAISCNEFAIEFVTLNEYVNNKKGKKIMAPFNAENSITTATISGNSPGSITTAELSTNRTPGNRLLKEEDLVSLWIADLLKEFRDCSPDKGTDRIDRNFAECDCTRVIPPIRRIYFNNRHTTIEWSDGVKTTVGCIEGQEFDEYSGFGAAVLKRLFGSSREAIRYMNKHKEVQPLPVKKKAKSSSSAFRKAVPKNA